MGLGLIGGLIGLGGLGVYVIVKPFLLDEDKFKKMSCNELRQHILDGKEHWKFAKSVYELRCI